MGTNFDNLEHYSKKGEMPIILYAVHIPLVDGSLGVLCIPYDRV